MKAQTARGVRSRPERVWSGAGNTVSGGYCWQQVPLGWVVAERAAGSQARPIERGLGINASLAVGSSFEPEIPISNASIAAAKSPGHQKAPHEDYWAPLTGTVQCPVKR